MKSQNKVPLHYMQSPQGSTGNGRQYDNFDILDLRMRKATVGAETGFDVDYRVLNFSNKTQTNKQTNYSKTSKLKTQALSLQLKPKVH